MGSGSKTNIERLAKRAEDRRTLGWCEKHEVHPSQKTCDDDCNKTNPTTASFHPNRAERRRLAVAMMPRRAPEQHKLSGAQVRKARGMMAKALLTKEEPETADD